MNEKSRYIVHEDGPKWKIHHELTTPPMIDYGVASPIQSLEKTVSRGHAWPSGRNAKTDVGGDFTTIKISSYHNFTPGSSKSKASGGRRYEGPAWPASPQVLMNEQLAFVTPSTDFQLMQKGTKAIARCIPTNPVVDGSTFLGELKAGVPKLIGKELFKTKFKDYRKYGSEYINVEFGWKPIISDLKKFGTAVTDSNKILEQLHRDSGKNVRRKYAFPDEVVTTSGRQSGRYCHVASGLALPSGNYDGTGVLTYERVNTTRTWFSGAFTYHLNLGNSLRDRIDRQAAEARKLYGLELTPEVAWNLAPWSWAADWEGSIGDVLHNVSRFSQDGLVLRYGYIMEEKTSVLDVELLGGGIALRANGPLRMRIEAKSKVRRSATPFGFGFDMTALNGRQTAILGALGISRGPRRL